MGDSDQALWERPWTTDELRQHSDNWTLAGDAGLLNHLQKLSESLLSRTHEVQKEVDSLVRETKLTNARMGIAVNDFLMLSNTQFVENRVYDEEIQDGTPVDEKKQDDQERTKERREQELVPRIIEALRKGLLVVNDAFESVDTLESENESELAIDASYQTLPLLQPKDYYQHRPLPHVIGSDRFMRDDTVGLGEIVTAVEVAESEHGSEKSAAESREEKSEEGTDDVSASEDDFPQHHPSITKPLISSSNEWPQKDDNESDDGDLFSPDGQIADEVDSESEEEVTIAPANRNGPVDFASELAAKLNLAANPLKDRDSEVKTQPDSMDGKKKTASKDDGGSRTSSRKSSRKNTEVKTKAQVPNTVPAEPEDEEADDSPFSKKGGLFSGGGGLFDDLNEEDSDLFSDVPKTRTKSKIEPTEEKAPRKGTRSSRKGSTSSTAMFDDDGDLFVSRKESKSSVKDGPTSKMAVSKKGLFDDNEEEDDLFAKLAAPRKASVRNEVSVNTRKSTTSSMGAGDEDLFNGPSKLSVEKEKMSVSSKESTPRKKKPAGAVSMFGPGVNPLAAAIRAHHRMSESDKEDVDENDWSDSEKTRPGSRSSKSSVSASSSKVESKIASRSNSVSSNGTSLFADDVDANDLFASADKDSKPKPKPVGGVSLFDDDIDDGDDLFSTAQVSKPKSSEKTPTKPPQKNSLPNKSVAQDSLIGAASVKARESSKPNPLSKDEQVEASTTAKPKELDKVEEDKTKAPKKLSLFDDDDDNTAGADLFVSPAKVSQDGDKLKEPLVKVRSRSLFDDEDVLFGGPQEEDPSVDLFKADDTSSLKKGSAPKKRSESKTSQLDELFEDVEDDDLFSNKGKDSKIQGKPPIPTPRKASLPKDDAKAATEEQNNSVARSPSTSVTKNIQDEPDASSPKKKPIGGVSLFGGLDPFGSKLSRSRSNSEVESTTKGASAGSPKRDSAFKTTPPTSPVTSDSIVMQRPTLKDTKEASISFDDPAEATTLHSANKDRAKIQVKRRPPSRKGRQDAFRKSAIFVDDDTESKASLEEASSSSFTSSPLTPEGGDGFDSKRKNDPSDSAIGIGKESSVMSPSTEEEDMFAIGDHVGLMTHVPDRTNKLNEDDLFSNDITSKTNSSDESTNMFGADEIKRDVQLGNVLNFSNKKAKDTVTNSKSTTKTSKSKVQTNDIFEDGSSNDEDIFASSDSRKKSLLRSNSKHGDDDLFSSASRPSTKLSSVDLFADDDDLFNTKSVKKSQPSKTQTNSLFEDEIKDDIFADLKPSKKTGSSTSLASKSNSSTHNDSKKNKGKSIFDDDDDDTVDLFNDPLLVKKK